MYMPFEGTFPLGLCDQYFLGTDQYHYQKQDKAGIFTFPRRLEDRGSGRSQGLSDGADHGDTLPHRD